MSVPGEQQVDRWKSQLRAKIKLFIDSLRPLASIKDGRFGGCIVNAVFQVVGAEDFNSN